MSDSIGIDALGDAFQDILGELSADIRAGLRQAGAETAAETNKFMKQNSPKRKSPKKGVTPGAYAKSWTSKEQKTVTGSAFIVYNKKYYMLTHLLENGHASRNGGRVEGIPHISLGSQYAQQIFQRKALRYIEEKL